MCYEFATNIEKITKTYYGNICNSVQSIIGATESVRFL